MNTEPVLELIQISRSYTRGSRTYPILRCRSLSVGAGEVVAIVGPSGSGKSTLLNIAGLIDAPDSGRVVLCQNEFGPSSSESTRASLRRRAIGYVFQHFHLVSSLSVLQNALLPALLNQIPDAESHAQQLLEAVGLSDRLHHLPRQLSGGEMQRCAIARALVHRPSLIIADEPTGSLDPTLRGVILDLLIKLAGNSLQQPAVLMATHSSDAAARASRVIDLGVTF